MAIAASKYEYPFRYKYVALYFTGHGGTDANGNPFVVALSGKRVLIETTIIEPLQIVNRIRLFFFDCCLSQPQSASSNARSVDTGRGDGGAPVLKKRPHVQGEVVAHAVSKGQVAIGDQNEGGVWTRRLCTNIMEPDPIIMVLAKTNRQVQEAGVQQPLTISNVDDTVVISSK